MVPQTRPQFKDGKTDQNRVKTRLEKLNTIGRWQVFDFSVAPFLIAIEFSNDLKPSKTFQVYIAREVDTQQGCISWCIDLSNTELVVHDVDVMVTTKVYESGQALFTLCGDDVCVRVNNTDGRTFAYFVFFVVVVYIKYMHLCLGALQPVCL